MMVKGVPGSIIDQLVGDFFVFAFLDTPLF